jgi:hypothetical protein
MGIEVLPESLLNGTLLHCQPIEGGPVVEAQIVASEDGSTPTFKKAIVCPARRSRSQCELRIKAGAEEKRCFYYRGDSLGLYQIIGPGIDENA